MEVAKALDPCWALPSADTQDTVVEQTGCDRQQPAGRCPIVCPGEDMPLGVG